MEKGEGRQQFRLHSMSGSLKKLLKKSDKIFLKNKVLLDHYLLKKLRFFTENYSIV